MKLKKHLKLLAILSTITCVLTGCGSSDSIHYSESVASGSYDSITSVNGFNSMGSSNTLDKGYSSSAGSSYTESVNESYADIEESYDKPQTDIDAEITLLEEKLVYSCDMELETLKYEDTYNMVKNLISEYNGVVENESSTDKDYNWYYSEHVKERGTIVTNINCRIPSSNYDEFVSSLSNIGDDTKLISQSQRVENISQEYYDNTSMIEALEIQEARLITMLESADTISDMIEVESRLSEVQYNINRLKTTVMYMDMDVAYSYVNIRIEEVKEYTTYEDETTFFSRLGETFSEVFDFTGELFEAIITFILYLIPVSILVFLPLGLVIYAIIKIVIKKARKYQEKQNMEIAARMAEINKAVANEIDKDTVTESK